MRREESLVLTPAADSAIQLDLLSSTSSRHAVRANFRDDPPNSYLLSPTPYSL